MADPSVTYRFTASGGTQADQADQNFDDIIHYLSDRNDGTVAWDDLVVLGPKPWIDVRAHGAICDGVTDDITAINAAALAAENAGGATILVPGFCAISSTVYLPTKVTYQGMGWANSGFVVLASMSAGLNAMQTRHGNGTYYTTGAFAEYGTVRNLMVDCTNMVAGVGAGIALDSINYGVVEYCYIKASQGYGIVTGGTPGTTDQISPVVRHCILQNCGRTTNADTIAGGHHTGSKYLYNIIISPNGTAIDNVNVNDAHWEGNTSKGAASHYGNIWSDWGMTNSRILNNYIENGSIHVYGFLGNPSDFGAPSNVLIQGNHIVNGGSSAILVSPANQVITDTREALGMRIIGNRIVGCIDEGITIADCPGAVIEGNHISNWDTGGGGADAAIGVVGGVNTALGCHDCVIAGNYGTPGGTTIWYNERVAGQTNRNMIYGNSFEDCTFTLDSTAPVSSYLSMGTDNVSGRNVLAVNTSDFVVDHTNGRVGIKTANPAYVLDVVGTFQVSSTSIMGGALTITPTSNQIVLGTTRTVTVTAPTPATASRTHTIPDITGNGTFAFLEGTQTFSGAKTFSATAAFAAITATSITDSGLTSGRVPYASTGGLLVDDGQMTYSAGLFTVYDGSANIGFQANGTTAVQFWQTIQSPNEMRIRTTAGVNILIQPNSATVLTVTSGGGIQVGAPTGADKGAGTGNFAGDVYKNNSAYANPDYVIEKWATGKMERFKDNDGAESYAGLLPISSLDSYLRENFDLPGVKERYVDTSGGQGIFARADILLEKMEEAFIYISELHNRVLSLEKGVS